MGRFSIDAVWVGEAVRLALIAVVALQWWQPTEQGFLAVLAFLSFVITGIVGARTASARVLDQAGTSVEQVKAVAANPDAQMVSVVSGRVQR